MSMKPSTDCMVPHSHKAVNTQSKTDKKEAGFLRLGDICSSLGTHVTVRVTVLYFHVSDLFKFTIGPAGRCTQYIAMMINDDTKTAKSRV